MSSDYLNDRIDATLGRPRTTATYLPPTSSHLGRPYGLTKERSPSPEYVYVTPTWTNNNHNGKKSQSVMVPVGAAMVGFLLGVLVLMLLQKKPKAKCKNVILP
jgi:hypothetical protein